MPDNGRVAVVTGGVQGIGAVICRELSEAGLRVVATDFEAEVVEQFAERTGLPAYSWNVADPEACRTGLDRIAEELGPVEILVNNAGTNRDQMFHEMSHADRQLVLDVDLGSMFNMTRPVIGGMRERGYGRIVNISSVNAQKGQAGQTNYCAAKAGVLGFTRALALESAAEGITVNAVAPGFVDTSMVQAMPDEAREKMLQQVPVGRLAEPAEIARCVGFLVSEKAGFITGATIAANGGLYMA